MALPPEIKTWTDKIYNLDKSKYKNLIKWVRAAQRTYRAEVIGHALGQFYPYAYKVGPDWWGYLDKILDKVEGDDNARQSQVTHRETRQAEIDYAKTLKS